MPSIMITGPVGNVVEQQLSPFGELVVTPDIEEATFVSLAADAVAIVCRGEARITRPVIDAAPELRVIGRTGVGVDSIDLAAASARGIPVINTPGANARSVAEGALTFALVLLKEVFHWDRQVRAGNWAARYELITRDLEDTVLGIVGFGNIGRTLASLALPLGLTVLASDPFVTADDARAAGVTLLPLEELLARADVVSLHATLTPETEGLINAATLALMKPDAMLINLGRGGLIDGLDILHRALETGRLRRRGPGHLRAGAARPGPPHLPPRTLHLFPARARPHPRGDAAHLRVDGAGHGGRAGGQAPALLRQPGNGRRSGRVLNATFPAGVRERGT